MSKELIYSYICELETDLKLLLVNNRFSELIICEIINRSIIMMHELVGEDRLTDEETTRKLVSISIEAFYTPRYLMKVKQKYADLSNHLHYGFRPHIIMTHDRLVEFGIAVDLERKEVVEEKDAMLRAVRTHKFVNKTSRTKGYIEKFLSNSTYPLVFVGLCILLGVFLNAYQHRYQRMDGVAVMDKWRGLLLVPNNHGKYVPVNNEE